MKRIVAGVAAWLAIVVLAVGVPIMLVSVGYLGALPSVDWRHAVLQPDDGTLLLAAVTLVSWVAWAVLTMSVVVEVAAAVRRVQGLPRIKLRVPGLEAPRSLVRGLVVAAVTLVVGFGQIATSRAAEAVPVVGTSIPGGDKHQHRSAHPADGDGTSPKRGAARTAQPLPAQRLHVVTGREDLWLLAVTYYGDGTQWRRIAEANRDLLRTRTDVDPGWRLVIPGSVGQSGESVVIVREGDSLWSLAGRYYGDPEQWRLVFGANRDVVGDPDQIDVGWRLRLPALPTQSQPAVVSPVATTNSESPATASVGSATPRAPATASPTLAAGSRAPSGGRETSESERENQPGPGAAERTEGPLGGGAVPDETPHRSAESSDLLAWGVVGTLGAGAAAAVIRTLRRRRALQLNNRPVGRRIIHADAATQHVENALGRLSGLSVSGSRPVVGRRAMATSDDESAVPAYGSQAGSRFVVDSATQAVEESPPEQEEASHVVTGLPIGMSHAIGDGSVSGEEVATDTVAPPTVTVGLTDEGPVVVDLEDCKVLEVDLGDVQTSWGAAAAWVFELVCGSDETPSEVVLVGELGTSDGLRSLDNVTVMESTHEAVSVLESVVSGQREELRSHDLTLGQARADLETRAAWVPRVFVLPNENGLLERLTTSLTSEPDSAVSVILVGRSDRPADTRRALPRDGYSVLHGDSNAALLQPGGIPVRPVALARRAMTAISTLLDTTGRADTTAASWFEPQSGFDGNVRILHPRTSPTLTKEVDDMGLADPGVTDFSYPTVLLLGPIRLLGANGSPPARAERSCVEYCAWLLEHPGAMATQMSAALLVAEGTRRSNVSRLRSWLGKSPTGEPYLPDAYSGRLHLDACVSSDWHRLLTLVAPGVSRTATETLVSALRLVRGAPLADAAPGQWHWAEELRTDMVSTIRDIGVIVAERALADHDIDLGRWATARALTAAPDDEALLRSRLRVEHQAGNRTEVERLVLRLTRHARRLGFDLDDDTITAIQEAIEGRSRARA